MAFSDPTYLIFLLFVAITLPFIRSIEARICTLVLVSVGFYISFSPAYALVLAFVTLWAFFCGIVLGNYQEGKARTFVFLVSLAGVLSPLLLFKYFFTAINALSYRGFISQEFITQIMLPVGLSFYTFQATGYLIDTYIGTIKPERRIIRFSAFMSFFPQLTAGPIARSTQLLPQFDALGKYDCEKIITGIKLVLVGFFMKVVIADSLSPFVDTAYTTLEVRTQLELFLATVFYPIQVYADFAGYSLIAIGSARLLGINLSPNFNHPYFSQTLPEFWRTWHISLSSWFRDYVFTPLHFRLRKYGSDGLAVALIFTFMLVGIWHGAGFKYVIFGLIHGVLVAASTLTIKRRDKLLQRYSIPKRVITVWRTAVTFTIVALSLVLFRADTISDAIYIYKTLIFGSYIHLETIPKRLPFLLCILFMAGDFIVRNKWHLLSFSGAFRKFAYHIMFFAIYLTLIYRWTDSVKDFQPFIYFKF